MKNNHPTRREFVRKTSGIAAAAAVAPYWFTGAKAEASLFESKNDRHVIGSIGTGSRWGQIIGGAMRYGDVVAVCDVDSGRAQSAKKRVGGKADVSSDYRKVLDRKDVDVVTIVTPDHWHTKIAIEAMKAGKDIYCEKPLTLTIDEGKLICKTAKETGRVFQVGTQQRSDMGEKFLTAVALCRAGRLGKIQKVQCAIGGAPSGGPFAVETPPSQLDWNAWLGQAPSVDYRKRRCHYEFRWWYEYSGGKMTDWGAHHVDIAQWAMNMTDTGPSIVTPVMAEHPVPFKDGHPTKDDSYNTATRFMVKAQFPNDIELTIRHDTSNGVLIEGDKGRIFVSRGALKGKPVEELKDNPISEEIYKELRHGKKRGNHMENFFLCIKDRGLPVSDVFSHHRAVSTCHLANIAIRLGRELKWDPKTEQIIGDEAANGWVKREQRKGFEIHS